MFAIASYLRVLTCCIHNVCVVLWVVCCCCAFVVCNHCLIVCARRCSCNAWLYFVTTHNHIAFRAANCFFCIKLCFVFAIFKFYMLMQYCFVNLCLSCLPLFCYCACCWFLHSWRTWNDFVVIRMLSSVLCMNYYDRQRTIKKQRILSESRLPPSCTERHTHFLIQKIIRFW